MHGTPDLLPNPVLLNSPPAYCPKTKACFVIIKEPSLEAVIQEEVWLLSWQFGSLPMTEFNGYCDVENTRSLRPDDGAGDKPSH